MISLKEAFINKKNLYKVSTDMIGPGDNLKDGDIALIACECLNGREKLEIKCGTFSNTDRLRDYPQGHIKYWNCTLDWEVLKNDYRWTYNDAYTHYILKVYRPKPGKERSLKARGEDIKYEDVKRNPNYFCVYENKSLMKRFGMI